MQQKIMKFFSPIKIKTNKRKARMAIKGDETIHLITKSQFTFNHNWLESSGDEFDESSEEESEVKRQKRPRFVFPRSLLVLEYL